MRNVKIVIIDKHDEILDIIREKIDYLVNFDWHADYPLYSESEIDIDYYAKQIDPVWYEENWVAILASRGYIENYIWIFPHDFSEPTAKILKSKNGNCDVINAKFDEHMKLSYSWISVDMDFFGSMVPVDWSPEDRKQLMIDMLYTLKGDDITLIISLSRLYTNYDVDKFLVEMISEIGNRYNILECSLPSKEV
jgi:hypothetical protein